MRKNLPLTGVEISFGESQRLISATDTSSKIIYCNDEFVEVSGYTQQELIGSPHNIVRHPDMPSSVYKHMWQCLKDGKCWMGIVKNRCKNGDHYWVEAYVTPITENGKIIGYESVRIKPCRERVTRAEIIYRKINSGTLSSPFTLQIKETAQLLATPLFFGLLGGGLTFALSTSYTYSALPLLCAIVSGFTVATKLNKSIDSALQETPNAFNDDLAAQIFTANYGSIARLRMVLISESARIRTVLTRLSDFAEQTNKGASDAQILANMTKQALAAQRAETDMAATAMTEMAASINEVASNIQNTAEQAENASQLVAKGSNVALTTLSVIQALSVTVEQVTAAVESLAIETDHINTAASLIQSIADQTNLLALNAAIEAARAGDQGRGFAVVADEVRSLAQKTRQSTESIQSVIATLRSSAKGAVDVARKGNHDAEQGVLHVMENQETLEGIKSAMERITAMSQQMAAAAEEQSHVAEDISKQISHIAQAADTSLENASKTSERGQELTKTAADLYSLTERFNG